MCDINKYRELYKEIEQLPPNDTMEIIMNTEDPEEQDWNNIPQVNTDDLVGVWGSGMTIMLS